MKAQNTWRSRNQAADLSRQTSEQLSPSPAGRGEGQQHSGHRGPRRGCGGHHPWTRAQGCRGRQKPGLGPDARRALLLSPPPAAGSSVLVTQGQMASPSQGPGCPGPLAGPSHRPHPVLQLHRLTAPAPGHAVAAGRCLVTAHVSCQYPRAELAAGGNGDHSKEHSLEPAGDPWGQPC